MRLEMAVDGFNQLYFMSFQWRRDDAQMLQYAYNLQAIMNSDNGLSLVLRYLNQCCFIVNWTPRKNVQCWNTNVLCFVQKMRLKCHLQNGGHFVSFPTCQHAQGSVDTNNVHHEPCCWSRINSHSKKRKTSCEPIEAHVVLSTLMRTHVLCNFLRSLYLWGIMQNAFQSWKLSEYFKRIPKKSEGQCQYMYESFKLLCISIPLLMGIHYLFDELQTQWIGFT